MSPEDSRRLLALWLDDSILESDKEAVGQIVERCGGLPLALAIVASRVSADPHPNLATVVSRMGQETDVLNVLDGGDATTDLRLVFDSSYQLLTRPAADLLRTFGHQTPSAAITPLATARDAGQSVDTARRALEELQRANLLKLQARDSYTVHPLVQAYAADLIASGRGVLDQAVKAV
jgi:hypothetical protein